MSRKVKDKRKLKNFILEYTHNAHAMPLLYIKKQQYGIITIILSRMALKK